MPRPACNKTHHPGRELVDVGAGAAAGAWRGAGAHGLEPGAARGGGARRGEVVSLPHGHDARGGAAAREEPCRAARARHRGPGPNAHLRDNHVLARHVTG